MDLETLITFLSATFIFIVMILAVMLERGYILCLRDTTLDIQL